MNRMSKIDFQKLYCDAYPNRIFSSGELKVEYGIYSLAMSKMIKEGILIAVKRGKYQIALSVSRKAYHESLLRKLLRYVHISDFVMAWNTIEELANFESENNFNFLILCLSNLSSAPDKFRMRIRGFEIGDILDGKSSVRSSIREAIFKRDFSFAKLELKQSISIDEECDVYRELCFCFVDGALKKQNVMYIGLSKLEQAADYGKVIDILTYLRSERALRIVEECLLKLSTICYVIKNYGILPKNTGEKQGPMARMIDNGEFSTYLKLCGTWQRTFNLTATVIEEIISELSGADDSSIRISPKAMYAFFDTVTSFDDKDLEGILKAIRDYLKEIGKPQLESLLTNTLTMCINEKDKGFRLLALAFKAIEGDELDMESFKQEISSHSTNSFQNRPNPSDKK